MEWANSPLDYMSQSCAFTQASPLKIRERERERENTVTAPSRAIVPLHDLTSKPQFSTALNHGGYNQPSLLASSRLTVYWA
jgi:hypothetical protein